MLIICVLSLQTIILIAIFKLKHNNILMDSCKEQSPLTASELPDITKNLITDSIENYTEFCILCFSIAWKIEYKIRHIWSK